MTSHLLLDLARICEKDALRASSTDEARHLLALRAELLDDAGERAAEEFLEALDLAEDDDLLEPLRAVVG